ncbi:MAG: SBBP repeat-containing protein [Planctomycetes bacterium]|nr:SBBP repeat-containing protein [Planctomycetota bacterium]
MGFVKNEGQWPADVLFGTDTPSGPIFIGRTGLDYGVPIHRNDVNTRWLDWVSLEFVNASASSRVLPGDPIGHVSFMKGSDPERWRTRVPCYAEVVIEDVYPGIDFRFSRSGRGIRYDLIVDAGADCTIARIRVIGAESVHQNASAAELRTAHGAAIEQSSPYSWWESAEGNHPTTVDVLWTSETEFCFVPSGPHRRDCKLVIDPVLQIPDWYMSFIGGSKQDYGFDVFVRGSTAYVTGCTSSLDFPVQGAGNPPPPAPDPEPFQRELSLRLGLIAGQQTEQDFDAFVAVVTAYGNSMLWCTYLGGSENQYLGPAYCNMSAGRGISVDGASGVYVAGFTNAIEFPTDSGTGFPTTSGAFQPIAVTTKAAPDAFVVKLIADGTVLSYSTLLSGYDPDFAEDIAVDHDGDAYVTGWTKSVSHSVNGGPLANHFPTTTGVVSRYATGTDDRGFVVKLNSTGSALVYSTFVDFAIPTTAPGALCRAYGIELWAPPERPDDVHAYIVGQTTSQIVNLPPSYITAAPQPFGTDGFVAVLDELAASWQHATYFGVMGVDDRGLGIAVDATGIYVCAGQVGQYTEPGPPSPPAGLPIQNSFQGVFGGGAFDGYVFRANPFAAPGNSLIYASYYGGAGDDAATNVVVDSVSQAYVCGYGGFTLAQVELPPNLYSTPTGVHAKCGFLIKVRGGPNGTQLKSQSFFGSIDSARYTEPWGLAMDDASIYIAGRCTEANNSPAAFFNDMQSMYWQYSAPLATALPTIDSTHDDEYDTGPGLPPPTLPPDNPTTWVPDFPFDMYDVDSGHDAFLWKVTKP